MGTDNGTSVVAIKGNADTFAEGLRETVAVLRGERGVQSLAASPPS
jgi:hypothetical protein